MEVKTLVCEENQIYKKRSEKWSSVGAHLHLGETRFEFVYILFRAKAERASVLSEHLEDHAFKHAPSGSFLLYMPPPQSCLF